MSHIKDNFKGFPTVIYSFISTSFSLFIEQAIDAKHFAAIGTIFPQFGGVFQTCFVLNIFCNSIDFSKDMPHFSRTQYQKQGFC